MNQNELVVIQINLLAGWIALLGGVISGLVMGLFFHQESWLGGYGSFRRRLLRLGHIAFFGLGFINLFFALSAAAMPISMRFVQVASAGLIVGALTMPMVCFLTAWRSSFRNFFPIPALSVFVALVSVLTGWWLQ